jgi:tetratricopeptide (TPR) repeat protein
VKIQFSLGALLRFLLLPGGVLCVVWIGNLIRNEHLSFLDVTIIALSTLGVIGVAMLFRLPIFSFLGMYSSGLRLTSATLADMPEDADGRDYILYQHSFFSYQLGNFAEALRALEAIDIGNVPEAICPLVGLNRALILEALFRAREAEEALEGYDESDFTNRMYAQWQACLANAKAGLGLDLEEALSLVESAFTKNPSAKIATVMGHVLWRMEHHEAAFSWFSYALKRMPRRERHFKSYTLFLQGRLFRDLGDENSAMQFFNRALASAPSPECRELYKKNWNVSRRRRSMARG